MAKSKARKLSGVQHILQRFPHASVLWEVSGPKVGDRQPFRVAAMAVNATVILVQEYHDGDGWQVYAPVTESGRIDVTLSALDKRSRKQEYDYLEKNRP